MQATLKLVRCAAVAVTLLALTTGAAAEDLRRGEVLFDLRNDPEERTNAASRQPGRADSLRREAERLLAERQRPEDVAAALSPETKQQLRELGYVE